MSNSIKLPPIRMSDIKTPVSPGTTESPTQVPRSRYTPPAKRAAVSEPVITSLDFSSNAFPSLDNSPVSVKSPVVGGYKRMILKR
jgi:hypothetical protein